MGKKIKNSKLLKKDPNSGPQKSTFNNFATKIQHAKEKKIEKMSQTKDRVINQKRENKLVRMPGNSKKVKKFALLDEEDNAGPQGLTHKGKDVKNMKHFNDMYFGSDDEGSFNQVEELHNKLNF